MQPNIADIAARLSEAQRATLVKLSASPQRSRDAQLSEAQCTALALDGLAETGFDKSGWYYTYSLTDLGLAVRKHLQESQNA